jgi:hypothetical protein
MVGSDSCGTDKLHSGALQQVFIDASHRANQERICITQVTSAQSSPIHFSNIRDPGKIPIKLGDVFIGNNIQKTEIPTLKNKKATLTLQRQFSRYTFKLLR